MSTTDVARPRQQLGAFDAADAALLRYLGLNPDSPADRAVVAVCRAYDFDPLLKHVIVIPKGGVYVTRDGLLHVAHRSGQFDGMVVEQDPTLIDGEWVAKVSVYRKDMRHPFTYPGRYPVNGGNRQYAQEMALKAAEAHALRRAFDITGLPAVDEQRPEEPRPQQASPPASGAERVRAALGHQQPAEVVHDAEVIESAPEPATRAQVTAIHARFTEWGVTDRTEKLRLLSEATGRTITSANDLTKTEASAYLDAGQPPAQDPPSGFDDEAWLGGAR